ncbi:sulfurtransferase [Chitinophaga sancti]|uniref:sulfurtransferase n=1 Tax=Chitinophaga sancti TaxID=1004 RepID=UPI002A764231|nr:sulfurtransferase [Chitinophaga sancti]WPQ64250.1 sulfurtransferase [Chitinophaga sancti]
MSYTTFIQPKEALENLQDPNFLFVDCSYSLADKKWGVEEYKKAHIPGAVYADLHYDLSGEIIAGKTSRHPLPRKEALVKTLSKLGIDENVQVVVYDATAGFMAAARMWWLLRWAGHEKVAVLNGGKAVWAAAGYPLTGDIMPLQPKQFVGNFNDSMLASVSEVMASIEAGNTCLIDSRTADRYAGQNETIDPVAGHIPTAISKPFNAQIGAEGVAAPAVYKDHFKEEFAKGDVVFYCGSGVTAAYNVLLSVYAGYPFPKLYAGSWSEWITDPARPVA